MSIDNCIKISDLNVASALVTYGYKLAGLDRASTAPRVQFLFIPNPAIEQFIESYWDNSLVLPAQQLFAVQKQLKNRLYAET
jgi:hypothetical protein